MDQALWLLRMGLMTMGGALTARGVGDAALWEAIAGVMVNLATAAWSFSERKKALNSMPPGK